MTTSHHARTELLGILRRTGLTLLACAGLALGASATAGGAHRVLFVGNSFTAGMHAATWRYRASTVHDLNGTHVGGVPALFKLFTDEAGLDYTVSVETVPGKSLQYHFLHEKAVLDRPWDDVVMQDYSTLDPQHPGRPDLLRTYARRLADLFVARNDKVRVWLVGTWSRPDMTYRKASPWRGASIEAMAKDLQRACAAVAAADPHLAGVVPVGLAFNRAVSDKVADPDPYDGIAYGEVNLWAYDNHHASAYGYYLEALMDFGTITGHDPRLGDKEQGAIELGLSPAQAVALQNVAYRQLHASSHR